MKKRLLVVLAAGLMLFGFTSMANALSIGSGWEKFYFGGVGSQWENVDTTTAIFNFSLAFPAVLTVTDAFNAGDRFSVYDGASFLGNTSVPTALGDDIGDNYDAAAADPRWSTGMFLLPAGNYSITGFAIDSPYGAGGAALQLNVSSVPEPATMFLLGTGLVGVAGAARRRKKNQA